MSKEGDKMSKETENVVSYVNHIKLREIA